MNGKVNILLALLLAVTGILNTGSAQNITNNTLHFYVGTYTIEGIYRFGIDTLSGKMKDNGIAGKSDNPSFLTLTDDGKYLLTVEETHEESNQAMGKVESFAIQENGDLELINKVSSGGADPCFVSVNKDSWVLVANYTGGNVALFKMNESGKISEASNVVNHSGNGPNAARQEKPHVHSAYFEPGGNRIFVSDLGIDQVKVYTVDISSEKLIPYKNPEIKLEPGSGPRHLAFSDDGEFLYVVNELNCTVTVVNLKKDGSFQTVQTVSTLPENYLEENTCAEIQFSPDGRFLYVSNRGLNSIAIFSVEKKTGLLKLIGQEPTKGKTPRNFTIVPSGKYLLVANQNSDNIVSFRRDENSGLLEFVDEIKAPKPVCLVFY